MVYEENSKPVLEEHAIPEGRSRLGGKSLQSTPDGKLERTTFLVTCDYCGRYPLKEFVICKSCRGKLCDSCLVRFDGRSYCRACLMEMLPLSRNSFKVLLCVKRGIESAGKISDVTRIRKDEVKASLALLAELKLIETKGLLVFLERKLTAEGVHALSAYRRVYGDDEDVLEVKEKLAVEVENGD